MADALEIRYEETMGYLIEVNTHVLNVGIPFTSAITDLRSASAHIEAAFWEAMKNLTPQSNGSTAGLRAALPRVQVSAQAQGTSSVWAGGGNSKGWELSEVHRQLCQVAVLIEALELVEKQHPSGRVTGLSPTQQAGADATGTDGNGGFWALEVFGGIDVRNNDKARKDRNSLLKKNVAHRYFACFDDAWNGYTTKAGRFAVVSPSSGGTPQIVLRSVV